MKNYKVTRIFEDSNRERYFEDKIIDLKDKGGIGFLSEVQETTGIIFRKVKADYDFDFHRAFNGQYIPIPERIIKSKLLSANYDNFKVVTYC